MFHFGLWRQANCENYLKCIFKVIIKDEATYMIFVTILLQSQVISNLKKKQKKSFFFKKLKEKSVIRLEGFKNVTMTPIVTLCLNFEIVPHSQTTTRHHSYNECMDWLFSVRASCHVHVNKVKPHLCL